MSPLRRPLAAAIALVLLAGCGVRPEASPHDVPEDRRPVRGPSSGSDAAGAERIYLVEPGEDRLLRSVPRDASTPEDLIEILLRGPNEAELDAEYSSAIPSTLELLGAHPQSPFLYLDVSEQLTELSGQGLVQALAQIVYTASELEGIDQVQITVRGEQISWPRANLESTTGPLRVYDYPAQVRTAQPAYPSVPSSG